MQQLKFNTSINCQSCVRAVSAFLDEDASISEWAVDTDNPHKVLSVSGKQLDASHIKRLVEEAGFDITLQG